jgi:phage terminase small subunit
LDVVDGVVTEVRVRQLTEQQKTFVREYVRNGGCGADAARAAGYAASRPAQQAHDLLALSHIQEAIHREQARLIGGCLASKAVEVVQRILHDEALAGSVAGQKLQLEAAKTVLDRAGHIAPKASEPEMIGDKPLAQMSLDELEAFIRQGQAALARVGEANLH